ncbi:hypothetical protein RBB78_15515 [Tunturiibacter empetritectus]|uniref:hypothetical protein n=1 Tax=Tunturiibacter empetritectus TaxID=3069691 RepID=UPI003D9BBB34
MKLFADVLRGLDWLAVFVVLLFITGCRGRVEEPGSVVVIIESSPNNLDLRVGADAQSERVGGLIFDALVKKDEHYELQPWARGELGAARSVDLGVSSARWGAVS